MCCDGTDYLMIRVGSRGCGKSERARKLLGMTHKEYEEYNRLLAKLLEIEKKNRELIDIFTSIVVGQAIIHTADKLG